MTGLRSVAKFDASDRPCNLRLREAPFSKRVRPRFQLHGFCIDGGGVSRIDPKPVQGFEVGYDPFAHRIPASGRASTARQSPLTHQTTPKDQSAPCPVTCSRRRNFG